jgi:hypothetical protein
MTNRLPIYASRSGEIIAYVLVDDDNYMHLALYLLPTKTRKNVKHQCFISDDAI